MKLTILDSKNGEKTAKIDDIFIHSNYAPIKETKKFCENIQFSINPKVIIVVEPGLSYLYSELKDIFPNAKIGIIRFSNLFSDYNKDWDFFINFFDKDIENFESNITSLFSEELICSTVFLSWTATKNIFKNLDELLWQKIKYTVENARTILITRQYFEKKWLINFCNNLKYGNFFKTQNIDLSNKEIAIVASGPSLEDSIEILRKYRNNLFIICLSSACSILNYFKIEPDLYLSTDGGFWAGEHLKILKDSPTPLLLPFEGFCKKSILKKCKIIPAVYNDGLTSKIINELKLNFLELKRNGTVSGTALDFAIENSKNHIYFLGLDLQGSPSFQHTKPNVLENNNLVKENKINNLETRQRKSQFNSSVLKIYRDWFCNYKKTKDVYRVIDSKNESLGKIKDIKSNEFENSLKNFIQHTETDFFNIQKIELQKTLICKKAFDIIKKNITSSEWQCMLFPLDFVSLNNTKSQEQKEHLSKKIEEKTKNLENKIRKIFDYE